MRCLNWGLSGALLTRVLAALTGRRMGGMTRRLTTIEERIALLEHAPHATGDEVTTLTDGRRLDSSEAVQAWLAEDARARHSEVVR